MILEAGGLQQLGQGGFDVADAASAEEGAVDAVAQGGGKSGGLTSGYCDRHG